jgi:AraC-like DNA-binding protein
VYRELAAPAPLAPLVECLWRRDLRAEADDPEGAVLPDGRVDLLLDRERGTLVAGPQTRALARPLRAPFAVHGLRLRPGAAAAVLGLPASELVDAHVPLAALDTPAATALLRRCEAAREARVPVAALAEAVAAADPPAPDPLVRAAADLLDRPGATVAAAAAAVALSERQLERRFATAVGLGPKTLGRVLRLQRFLAAARRSGPAAVALARLAAEAGYADQAHLTREARRLTGRSPAQLAASNRPAPASALSAPTVA